MTARAGTAYVSVTFQHLNFKFSKYGDNWKLNISFGSSARPSIPSYLIICSFHFFGLISFGNRKEGQGAETDELVGWATMGWLFLGKKS